MKTLGLEWDEFNEMRTELDELVEQKGAGLKNLMEEKEANLRNLIVSQNDDILERMKDLKVNDNSNLI